MEQRCQVSASCERTGLYTEIRVVPVIILLTLFTHQIRHFQSFAIQNLAFYW